MGETEPNPGVRKLVWHLGTDMIALTRAMFPGFNPLEDGGEDELPF